MYFLENRIFRLRATEKHLHTYHLGHKRVGVASMGSAGSVGSVARVDSAGSMVGVGSVGSVGSEQSEMRRAVKALSGECVETECCIVVAV